MKEKLKAGSHLPNVLNILRLCTILMILNQIKWLLIATKSYLQLCNTIKQNKYILMHKLDDFSKKHVHEITGSFNIQKSPPGMKNLTEGMKARLN